MALRRNLRLYLPYRILSLEGVCHGIYLLWWVRERKLDPAAVAALMGAADLLLMALEVPTGILADRIGYRPSLILGSAAQAASLLLAWLAVSVPEVAAACLLNAVGDALRSGANEALLHDTCAALGEPEAFERRLARAEALTGAALVALTALGGWVAGFAGVPIAWALETVVTLAGLAVAVALIEPPRLARLEAPEGFRVTGRGIPWLVLVPGSLVTTGSSCAGFLATLVVSGQGTGPFEVALFVAGLQLMAAAGAAAISWRPDRISGVSVLYALMALALAAAAAVLAHPDSIVRVAPVFYFLDGAIVPLRAALLQQRAADGDRARVTSLASASDMALKAIALPAAAGLSARRP